MARQKQTKPSQRVTSSELVHIPTEEADLDQTQLNGTAANANSASACESSLDSPGLIQLAVCVLGIYASLYVDYTATVL